MIIIGGGTIGKLVIPRVIVLQTEKNITKEVSDQPSNTHPGYLQVNLELIMATRGHVIQIGRSLVQNGNTLSMMK